jgi:DNA-binding NarL/FixJ family response regulator
LNATGRLLFPAEAGDDWGRRILTIRVQVVENFVPFRQFICRTLTILPNVQIICESSDGLDAVQKAEEREPDLILMDIGLPQLNGIDAARQIRKVSAKSKILFVSQESSSDVAQETFRLGGLGYVVKTHAGRELLAAVESVLEGKQFVSGGLSESQFDTSPQLQADF